MKQVIFVVAFVSLEWAFSTISDNALPNAPPKAIDAVWICTTHKPYTAHVIGTRTHSAHPMFLPMCRFTSVAYLFAYASTEKQDDLRMQR
nr:MAG TPA: hypothetical protein [Caudoviricetes sp.]